MNCERCGTEGARDSHFFFREHRVQLCSSCQAMMRKQKELAAFLKSIIEKQGQSTA